MGFILILVGAPMALYGMYVDYLDKDTTTSAAILFLGLLITFLGAFLIIDWAVDRESAPRRRRR